MSGAQILRELVGGWCECRDNQGIFYHNRSTGQSSDAPPPELVAAISGQQQQQQYGAMSGQQQQQQPVVLQELPGNWLKCKDAQGIYYFNQLTQQSSDQLPPELAMMAMGAAAAPAPAPAAAPKVLRKLPGNWLECQDAEGIFYFNEATRQSTVQPPAAPVASYSPAPSASQGYTAFQSSVAQPQMYSQTSGIAAMQQQAMQAQMMLAQSQAQAQAAKSQPQNAPRQKLTLGDWAVYEDQQGEFYVNISTGQQFDKPPQALLQAYQAAVSSGQLR